MISEYINPHQSLGDFYLSACEKPTLKLPYDTTGHDLTDGERNANLTTIVEYAAEFVSSIEVPIKPKFSCQYIENYHIIARTILNRDVPQNDYFQQALEQFDGMVSQLSDNRNDGYERIGIILRDYEESYGKSQIANRGSFETTNLMEIGFSIAWGAYRISRTHGNTVEVIKHSILGALKGAMISNYKGVLGGAISHGLIAQSMGIREATLISSNVP